MTNNDAEKGRIGDEHFHFDAKAEQSLARAGHRMTIDDSCIPWNRKSFVGIIRRYLGNPENLNGMRILDCGCGQGFLSVYTARKGALVSSFDVSPMSIQFLRLLAEYNGVADQIDSRVCEFENLEYPDSSFDLVLGTAILHHVNLETAIRNVLRVLKPGGKAFFWEPSEISPVIRLARNAARFLNVRKLGTAGEHPITCGELERINAIVEGRLHIHRPPRFLFSLINKHVLKHKIRSRGALLTGVDRFLSRHFPAIDRHGLHVILVIENH